MSPLRWQEIERVFNETVERPQSERSAFLAAVCAGDPKLREEVEALLAQNSSEKNLLDQPVWELLEESADSHTINVTISPGTQLGPYKIEARLGAGGMGEVFRAYDTRLGRIVAIKVLPGAFSSDPSFAKRLLQEARAASALNHPNIITVHDISRDGGIDFLVMEYVPGNSLKELLTLGGLSLTDALNYIAQAADGLAAAHAAGIVHRDIKPGNIMITPQKQVKVLDFGIAKRNPALQECATEALTQLTSPGTVIGTLAYMSPEQTGGENIDGRSDIFSLCVVLYEAASGRLPFHGVSALSLVEAIATVQPAKASTINTRIPKS
ncbi:MAG: serine/threonine protein kinase [Candidatus Eremiobacteraeota bacterium]|nr:serine/threonine protein kinase [Candidatus Eremiobacteraeota bacterium]